MTTSLPPVIAALRSDNWDAAPKPGSPLLYRGRPLRSSKVDGERSVGPAELLDRIRPVLRPAGITRLADITGLDRLGVPVTMAVRPNGLVLSNSAGKGLTLDDALASAAMEALELHHAEQWSVPTERLTYHEAFRHLDAPPPDRLPLTDHGPFLPDWPYAWVRGWDLNGQREVAVPAAMVRMGDRRGRLENLFSFQVTSNGLASGANLVEAIHSGLLEVIERDAVTCWQHRWTARGEPPPTVSTAAHTSEVITDLLGRLAANGARVLLFDCTIDTQVPVYMAFLFDEDDSFRGIYKGFGAHLDPDRAIVRAITEACQARAVHIAGSRDDLFRHRLTATGVEEQFRSMVEMHRRTEESRAGELPLSVHFDTFEDDVAYLVDRLADVGLDRVVVVDLSKPYLPVAVVKVVVPGMEGFMVEDYTPGFRALRFAGGD